MEAGRPRAIDLNADLGEGCPWDEAILDRVTSANVCCGAHAGDQETIRRTLRAASRRGVVVGAHPGYPDRENFGRAERSIVREQVADLVRDQLDDLGRLAAEVGVPIRFVKPHGALYNQAQRDPEVAAGLIAAVGDRGLPLVGQPRSRLQELARAADVPFIAEGFVDRRYAADGRLVPRSEPGAILHDADEIRAQVIRLAESGDVQTLCLHGDNPEALRLADLIVATLDDSGFLRRSFA